MGDLVCFFKGLERRVERKWSSRWMAFASDCVGLDSGMLLRWAVERDWM